MPTVKLGDINLCYKVNGKGQPLIMIAGFATAQNMWLPLLHAFSQHYRVVTLDNRGVGGSDKPSGPYTTNMMADDTVALMDHLGIDRAHILGGSLGGMIAQHIAIDHPQRVDKLILFSTSAGGQPLQNMLLDLAAATTPNWNRSNSTLVGADLRKLTAAIAARSFNAPFNRLVIISLAVLLLRLGMTRVPAGQVDAMMTHNVLDRLNLIQAPTLVLTGSADRLMPPQSSQILASNINGARLITIEGGSHALAERLSGRFIQEVLDFLGSVGANHTASMLLK
mgnify:CR=1 FL=1